ncbi:MAG: SOS response-associated peptidase family protein, partial [Clostridia bacterium]|nr:SOS response-associated peptidase family protein [Clostridia bacterium]
MCGRFYIEDAFDWADVLRLMGAQNRRLPEAAKRSGEVNPTDAALVLAPSKDLSPGAFAMRWGYLLPDGHLVINARSETARSRPLFADGMRRRRCAVPVSGYIEWDRSGSA